MKKATIQLDDLACPSCGMKIEAAVKSVDGVNADSAKVLFNASKVKLEFDEDKTTMDEIKQAIEKVGYEVKKSSVR